MAHISPDDAAASRTPPGAGVTTTGRPSTGADVVAHINARLGELETAMGIVVTAASPERVVATMAPASRAC